MLIKQVDKIKLKAEVSNSVLNYWV